MEIFLKNLSMKKIPNPVDFMNKVYQTFKNINIFKSPEFDQGTKVI